MNRLKSLFTSPHIDSTAMQMIVGLGNPGEKYVQTRHNAGWIMIDQLMQEYMSKPRILHKSRNAMVGEVTINDVKFITLKPLSYMNRSGATVKSASSYYKITPQHILVIHDEIDRVFGKIGLKQGGGHAGHNGLRDIITHLGTNDFARIRIGVDRPADKSQVSDHVLSNFTTDQMQWMHSEGYITVRTEILKWINNL